ncbi:MAG: cyclic pyranopterin monophosphate synthase MoaC [Eubacteriales bacterium]|nr:cyclic pyranopterin monophosphate synthase MoaC [Eubacteriales bacterium]
MDKFTHLDEHGNAIMVDVSNKNITNREAIAIGYIKVNSEIIKQIKDGNNKKGDVLAASRIAGIMATKKNYELIPLCHPLLITKATIDFEIKEDKNEIHSKCTVVCDGKTGVEMEALMGVSVSLLTIYDMCKAIDKTMTINDIMLYKKSGGASGVFINESAKE